jgi:hypothetical protein
MLHKQTDCEPDRVISLYLNCTARTVFSLSLVMHAVLANSFMLVTTLSAPSSWAKRACDSVPSTLKITSRRARRQQQFFTKAVACALLVLLPPSESPLQLSFATIDSIEPILFKAAEVVSSASTKSSVNPLTVSYSLKAGEEYPEEVLVGEQYVQMVDEQVSEKVSASSMIVV